MLFLFNYLRDVKRIFLTHWMMAYDPAVVDHAFLHPYIRRHHNQRYFQISIALFYQLCYNSA